MRQRIDDRAKKQSLAVLEKSYKEIVVGAGRAQEPYIIAFHYASDNVAGKSLGTLFGFFEVEIHDQDAAYIVNFLTSVAKKEYFANPRRSPTDSFDAALHKINVALAEIVKHGNVSWLGHLHGAIGAVNENLLHFSATGEGELYLARNDSFQSISQGLADTGSEPHPLKTFTEVSSGELFDGDLVIAFSPSIWSLFSPGELARSLSRLGPAGFEQFLRTALINELPVAAAAILLCSAPVEVIKPAPARKESKKPPISLENVWSGKPFSEALQSKHESSPSKKEPSSQGEVPKTEYTDAKTGHIYVQASNDESFRTPDTHWKESWDVFRHHFDLHARAAQASTKKTFRRISKESGFLVDELYSQLSVLKRAAERRTRLSKRSIQLKWQAFREARQVRESENRSIPVTEIDPPTNTPAPAITISEPSDSVRSRYVSLGEKARATHLRVRTISMGALGTGKEAWHRMVRKIANLLSRLFSAIPPLIQNLSTKGWLFLITGCVIMLALSLFLFSTDETGVSEQTAAPAVENTPATAEAKVFPPADEPLSIRLSGDRTLSPIGDAATVALTNINDVPFLITGKRITNLKTQESTNAPETIRLATGMDDLDALFLLSESGALYLYSVTNKKFELNTLPLASGTNIDALGSYLTYLYVLDQTAGKIYRFPRAEGGFGDAITWSKETLNLKEKSAMSVYENIALVGNDGRPIIFTRGKNTGVVFSGSAAPVMTDTLSFNPKNGDVFALDRGSRRILRWSLSGVLINQYFHESFSGTEAITVSNDGTELLTSSHGAVAVWRIQ